MERRESIKTDILMRLFNTKEENVEKIVTLIEKVETKKLIINGKIQFLFPKGDFLTSYMKEFYKMEDIYDTTHDIMDVEYLMSAIILTIQEKLVEHYNIKVYDYIQNNGDTFIFLEEKFKKKHNQLSSQTLYEIEKIFLDIF